MENSAKDLATGLRWQLIDSDRIVGLRHVYENQDSLCHLELGGTAARIGRMYRHGRSSRAYRFLLGSPHDAIQFSAKDAEPHPKTNSQARSRQLKGPRKKLAGPQDA